MASSLYHPTTLETYHDLEIKIRVRFALETYIDVFYLEHGADVLLLRGQWTLLADSIPSDVREYILQTHFERQIEFEVVGTTIPRIYVNIAKVWDNVQLYQGSSDPVMSMNTQYLDARWYLPKLTTAPYPQPVGQYIDVEMTRRSHRPLEFDVESASYGSPDKDEATFERTQIYNIEWPKTVVIRGVLPKGVRIQNWTIALALCEVFYARKHRPQWFG